MSPDRSFAVNRLWPILALPVLLICILIFAGIVLSCGAASFVSAMELPRRIGECVMSFFVAIIFAGVLLYLCASFQSLVKTLRSHDPALTVSSEGFKYLFASDDVIPWTAIEDIVIEWHWGRDILIRFQLEPGFADTLRWRGSIANSFKPDSVSIMFRYIKAPTAEVEEALLTPLQSRSVPASSAVYSKANELLSRNYRAVAAHARQGA